MSRLSFFFTTLLAALPAAFLGYLCVTAFLLKSQALSAMLMVVIGITLLLCVAVIAMPVAVLLKSKGREAVAEPADAKTPAASDDEASEEAAAASEDDDLFVEGDADEFDAGDDLEDVDQPRK